MYREIHTKDGQKDDTDGALNPASKTTVSLVLTAERVCRSVWGKGAGRQFVSRLEVDAEEQGSPEQEPDVT